ncbi:virulence factor MviN [Microlunatus elymi]|uniref:Virulence factor MviN n=1 Tax=Microlunatus elymi TaxID=2596828 RepID=A0A516Q1I6_9ACTN|nr:lipid II flippase MurJ [Microlunatus elymi]QDP97299.1 virulence factor MviN [Microlunatus elymi]
MSASAPGRVRGRGRFAQVAAGVAALTLASRIVGFGRWLVFSKTVGDTCLGDAYNSANQLPNVLFEIAAGGVLASVVVPVISRQLSQGRDGEASRTASAILCWTLILLTPFALGAMVLAQVYAEGFVQSRCAGAVDSAASLLVIFGPQIWLYGLAVVSAGVLQAHRRFVAAAAAPLASSATVISTYIVFGLIADPGGRDDPALLQTRALDVLGWGTTAGVLVLASVTFVPLLRLRLRLRPTVRFPAGVLGVISAIAGASVAGLIIQQLSVMAGVLAAKQSAVPGAWTRATWANAVYLLPFAVLVSPLLQMIFPRLSAASVDGFRAVAEVLSRIGPPLCTLSALGAGLLIADAVPVARLLVLGPGSAQVGSLAWPIIGYAPAVVGFALMGLATRTLYAERRARRAGLTNVIGWAVVIIGVVLVGLLAAPDQVVTGIAMANSLGMVVGAVVGWALILTDWPERPRLGLARPLLRGIPIGLAAGALVAVAGRRLGQAGIVGSALGAVGAAVICTLLFALGIRLLDRRSWSGLLALRHQGRTDESN